MRKRVLPAVCLLALLFLAPAIDGRRNVLAAEGVYHGNGNSHVFHRPGCRYYNCKHCVVAFGSRQQALDAGFRPCKICRP